LEDGRVELGEDGGPVGNEEASSAFGGFLEAYEGRVGRRAFCGGFAVEAYVVSAKGGFVDLLVVISERVTVRGESLGR